MGFLKIEGGDGGVVLFHLNQVWVQNDQMCYVPLWMVQKGILERSYLKVGTAVMVNLRKLPAHQNSQLYYQATIVWKADSERSTSKLLSEYIQLYAPHEKRQELSYELDSHHDTFKRLTKLGYPSTDGFSNIDAVPVVLNGLPPRWAAVVIMAINEDYGIIRIAHEKGLDLECPGKLEQSGVKKIHAVFHIEGKDYLMK